MASRKCAWRTRGARIFPSRDSFFLGGWAAPYPSERSGWVASSIQTGRSGLRIQRLLKQSRRVPDAELAFGIGGGQANSLPVKGDTFDHSGGTRIGRTFWPPDCVPVATSHSNHHVVSS